MQELSTDHALNAGPVPPGPSARGRASFAVAVVVALAVHAGALYAAMALKPHTLGTDGAKVDAIAVTVVPGEAQESAVAPVIVAPATSSAAVAATEGDAPVSAVVAAAPPPPLTAQQADPAPATRDPGDIVTASLPLKKRPTEPPAIEPPPPATQAAPVTATEGGAVSRAEAVAPAIDAAAGAPPGVVDAFRLAVQQALRKSKPPYGRGRGGATAIVFTIGPSGSVEAAKVQASSGDPTQDQMAIAAVRVTRFPTPDPRLTPAQRTWPISYQFAGSR